MSDIFEDDLEDSDEDYIVAEVLSPEDSSQAYSNNTQVVANSQATGLARTPPNSHPYIQRSAPPPSSRPQRLPRVIRKLNSKYKLKGYRAISVLMDDKVIIFK